MKKKYNKISAIIAVLIGMLLIGSAIVHASIYKDLTSEIKQLPDQTGIVSVTLPFESYDITNTDVGQKISVENLGRLLIPGKPNLPSKIYAIAIPAGAKVKEITFFAEESIILPGNYQISPSPLTRVLGDENKEIYEKEKKMYDENYNAVYTSDNCYPVSPVELVGTGGYHQYNLVDVRVTPFSYKPLSQQLIYYPEITVNVHYIDEERSLKNHQKTLRTTQEFAEQLIVNYEEAQPWYPPSEPLNRGLHDFVIITLDSLTVSVAPLVDWETTKGRTVEVVTTSWIDINYAGYDLAEKIRNFLREKYPADQWGIEDVLIVGHYDNVPMRRTAQDAGYGEPETDYYYAELSLPDSESWDADGDHQYGEDYDDSIDFYAEINVGRIPWSSQNTVLSICEKSVAYEQNNDPSYKKNILLLGAYFWNGDPNPVTDNAVLMEAKVDQPWMSDWTMTRLYEKNSDCWSSYDCDLPLTNANVMSTWTSDTFAFVNWAGHGSPISSHIYGEGAPAFIETSNCPSLDDDYPAIIFADACSNSDTDHDNIGQMMMQQGAVGFLGATKVAYGCPGWTEPSDGSTQSLDYYFTSYVTSGDYTIGKAHQKALLDMYQYGLWGSVKYEMFEWGALWGNPDLEMLLAPLKMSFPNGLPEFIDAYESTSINVQISEITDTIVPGSEMIHYRFNGGSFETATMTHIRDNQYQAVLPYAHCGDTPEYYFTVEGVSSGEMRSPSNAPTSTYSVIVGEIAVLLTDNFEIDTGWTTSAGASTGNWERADPQEVYYSYLDVITQPEDDHSSDGSLCFVTQAASGSDAGTYDVDGGPTYLTSPTYNLQGLDATISYWRWYHISTEWDDALTVEISNDNGGSWTTIETVENRATWTYKEWRVSDFVTPTDQIKIRFTAVDSDPGSLIEALIDDFAISHLECSYVMCGDANSDGQVNVGDAVYLVNYIFKDGPAPVPEVCVGDANGDGETNVGDAVYLVNYIFKGGPEPEINCCN